MSPKNFMAVESPSPLTLSPGFRFRNVVKQSSQTYFQRIALIRSMLRRAKEVFKNIVSVSFGLLNANSFLKFWHNIWQQSELFKPKYSRKSDGAKHTQPVFSKASHWIPYCPDNFVPNVFLAIIKINNLVF